MTKRTKRSAPKAASWIILQERVDYLEDPDDDHHANKSVLPARNYRCNDQSKKAFVDQVRADNDAYYLYRKSNRLKGPTTKRIFDEIIYSSEKGAFLTPAERDAIEAMLVEKFGANAAVRTAWHIDPNGRADLHLLIAAKAPTIEDPDAYEVIFGKAIGHSIVASISCDRQIAELLNANPDRKIEQTAAIDVRAAKAREKYKTKDTSLAQQIAKRYPRVKITAQNIEKALTKLGHDVRNVTEKAVRLIFKKCFREQELPLRNLLLSVGEAQVRLVREKKLEATPFGQLRAYFEAAIGRTKVRPRKLTQLTKATKGMLTKSGVIKRAVLDKLSESEKATLAPLAEAYLKKHKDSKDQIKGDKDQNNGKNEDIN